MQHTVNLKKKIALDLFSRNFANAEFRANRTPAKFLPSTDVGKSCPSRDILT